MKRVYLILTLFMTSFFFISINEVRADTIDFNVSEDEISFVETDLFNEIRDLVIEEATRYNYYYLITIKTTDNYELDTSNIIIYMLNKADFLINHNSSLYFNQSSNRQTFQYYYSSVNKNLGYTGIKYYSSHSFMRNISSDNILYSYINYLDTNIEFLPFNSDTNSSFNIKYNNFVYTVNPGEHFPSLYQLKLLNDNSSGGSNVERNDSLDSFYTLIIEKIQTFAINFISNNSCLFILGTIILIFVSELVRRLLL